MMSLSMDLQMLGLEITTAEPLFVDAAKIARWAKRLAAAADRANAQERTLAQMAQETAMRQRPGKGNAARAAQDMARGTR